MSPWRTLLVALVAVFTLLAPAVAFAEVPPVRMSMRSIRSTGIELMSTAAWPG